MNNLKAYNVDDAKMFFPPETQTSGGGFTPADSGRTFQVSILHRQTYHYAALTLSVVPGLTLDGTVTAHLIPEIKLGLEAFTFVKAAVYLDLDASASVSLDLNAGANATVTGTGDAAATGEVDGCVDIGAAFSVNVGASGSLFGAPEFQINLRGG